MTFEAAAAWLRSVGGSTSVRKGVDGQWGSILVRATCRVRGEIERRAPYDTRLTGAARLEEFRRAFVEAVEQLRRAFQEQ